MLKIRESVGRVFRVLWMGVAAAVFVLSNAVFVVLAFPIALLLSPFPRARSRVLSLLLRGLLNLMFAKAAPFCRVFGLSENVRGVLARRRGAVIVCNHITLIDPMLLLSFAPDTGVLIKRKYDKWPAIRFLLGFFDFIALDGTSSAEVSRVVGECVGLLRDGKNLLVFPEGTRSRSGRVGDFKSLAFKLAKDENREVVALCIRVDSPFFSKGQKGLLPARKPNFKMDCAGVFDPSDYRNADVLCAAVQRAVSKKCREPM